MARKTNKGREYALEVLDYERKYYACGRSNDTPNNGYHPIVPKLLLSIYLRLGVLLGVLSILLGVVLVCVLQ